MAWFQVFVDWDGDADFGDANEEITNDVIRSFDFMVGCRTWQTMSDDNAMSITLSNSDQKYSPENTSSVLYGYMKPNKTIKITFDSRVMYVGVITEYEVTPLLFGERVARLHCKSIKTLMDLADVYPVLYEDVTADYVIERLLMEVAAPPANLGYWILGITGKSELGITTRLGSLEDVADLQSGTVTLPYVGDNIQGADNNALVFGYQGGLTRGQVSTSAWMLIRDMVEIERGRFFFNEQGQATFWNRSYLQDKVVTDYTILNTQQDGSQYITPYKDFYNVVEVQYSPRTESETATELLWSTPSNIVLQPGENRTIFANYENNVGAKDVATPSGADFVVSEGSASVAAFTPGAQRAEMLIQNLSASLPATITALNVRGRTIVTNTATYRGVDADSVREVGFERPLQIKARALDTHEAARDLADFELRRRAILQGYYQQIVFRNKKPTADTDQIIAMSIGDRINLQDTQLSHNLDYHIVGTRYDVDADNDIITEANFMIEPAFITRLAGIDTIYQDAETPLMDASAYAYIAQSFEVPIVSEPENIRLRLRKVGTPAGTLALKLFADKVYTGTWELGITGKSELGVMTKLLPAGDTSVPYDRDTEATAVLDGSVSASTTFTHTADCEIWFEVDTLPSASVIQVIFRRQDASNNWIVDISNTGALILYELIAGAPSARDTAIAGTVSNGSIGRIICDNETISFYVDGVLEMEYTSAANFKTQTDGVLFTLGTGGVIKDLVANRLEPAAVAATAEILNYTFYDAGSVAASTTFTHEANCRITYTNTTLPSAGANVVRFRIQNASNYWYANNAANGALHLFQVTAGVPTLRDSAAAGTLTNGSIVDIFCDGETITFYVDGIEEVQYTSSSLKSETDGLLSSLGTGGAVSDLIVYPYPGNADDLGSGWSWMDFVFDTPPSLSTSTRYWWRLETLDSADADNYVSVAHSTEEYLENLSAFWDFYDDADDATQHAHDLTNINAVTFNDEGYAVFDLSAAQYFELGDHPNFRPGRNNFCISFDYRQTQDFTTVQYIVQKWDYATGNEFVMWVVDGLVRFLVSSDGTNATECQAGVTMQPHVDYRITLWKEFDWLTGTGVIGVSVNGTENTEVCNHVTYEGANDLYIGFTNGWIRRFAFWRDFAPDASQRAWIAANSPAYADLDRYLTGDLVRREASDGWKREHADSIFEVLA